MMASKHTEEHGIDEYNETKWQLIMFLLEIYFVTEQLLFHNVVPNKAPHVFIFVDGQ